jgi:hypothetical protein
LVVEIVVVVALSSVVRGITTLVALRRYIGLIRRVAVVIVTVVGL